MRRFPGFPILRTIVLTLFVGIAPAFAGPDFARAKEFLLDGVIRAGEILKDHRAPRAEMAAKLRAEFRRRFDVPAIAAFVLGPAYRTLTPEQKRRYLHAFEEVIVQTYTGHVFRVGPLVEDDISDIIRVTGSTRVAEDQLMLHSEINRRNANWVKIDWRLREQEGRIKIIDIVVLGISQVQVYRSEFASVMRRNGNGVEGLIQTLVEKSEALRNAGASSRN